MKSKSELCTRAIMGTVLDLGDDGGQFLLPLTGGVRARCIVSWGGGWDHVSVSLGTRRGQSVPRCPTWDEMCQVKRHFFHDEECVVQFHPPKSEYVNTHEYVLHLWRNQHEPIVLPPKEFV